MVATSALTLTDDNWTVLHSGEGDALVQLRTFSGAAEIVAKTGSEPAGNGPHGVILDKCMPAISLLQLEAGDVVYGRSFSGSVIVAVISG